MQLNMVNLHLHLKIFSFEAYILVSGFASLVLDEWRSFSQLRRRHFFEAATGDRGGKR